MKRKFLGLATILILTFSNHAYTQEKEVSFNSKYIRANDGKTTIEINEAQELTYIIMAMTDFASKNPITRTDTDYYKDVKAYFSKYADLPAVVKFDNLLKENIVNYLILSGNAYGFEFNGNRLVPTAVYDFPAKGIGKYEVKTNPILTYIKELEEFAKKSGYRKFYKSHLPYYNSLKAEYINYANLAEQKKWLESRFDYKINSYRVLTSPLISSINATHTFEDNNFKEMLLFLPTIQKDKDWSEKYKKAINTRIIFTEIDHNYVGPVSNKYLDKINTIFNNRDKWINSEIKSTTHYPNPLKVHDEYLTWGLFVLYAYDKFGDDKELLSKIVDNVNSMLIKRGFIRAKEFNLQLLNLYQNTPNKKIENLYLPMLEWSAKQ